MQLGQEQFRLEDWGLMKAELSVATGIYRGYSYDQVRSVAEVLLDSRYVKNMEVTLNTEGCFETIEKLSNEFGSRLNIGAGTVLDIGNLKRAVACGARFALAPDMMTSEMITYCNNNDVVSIPGAYSPSEIHECFRRGCDIVKVFPANELSHSYANKVKEPLGDLKLMAVGGVNASNIKDVLSGGYSYVGSAGGIFKKEHILEMDSESLAADLHAFENGIDSYYKK